MRKIAFDIVYGTLEQEKHSDELFQKVVEGRSNKTKLTRQEKNFVRRLSFGTIERAIELDWLLDYFSNTPVKKMKPFIRTILRMGAYEICYMDAVPAAASCNEMVNLTKKKGFQNLAGFVNGILRNLARADREAVKKEILAGRKTEAEKLSFRYSVPEDLAKMLLNTYGKKTAEKVLASFYEDKPLTIRVQTKNVSVEQVLDDLKRAGIEVQKCKYIDSAFRLWNVENVESLPGFCEGHFTVQNESSMLPVQVSGIIPGHMVLDVCSSPGGKAFHAVNLLRGQGLVSARDVSEKKIEKIQQNAKRLRAENIEIKIWDGTVSDEEWRERADVVIADVPCSGIGVIGKKPEIKYGAVKRAEELVDLQRKIVDAAITMLKPGGILIYSTCTINPAENEENAQWIQENQPVDSVSLDEYLPECLRSKMTVRGRLQILPGVQEGDGFFVAKFKKKC